MVFGIHRAGDSPTSAKVLVDGEERFTMGTSIELDITDYLVDPVTKKIKRDSFIRLGVLPNSLAYVTIALHVQGFIQSRGGGTY